jgi:hypothetical protein
MATTLKVKNEEEWEMLVEQKDIRISKALIDTVIKNINGKKRYYHALSIVYLDEDRIFDLTIEKSNFLFTLKENLQIFEREEQYEECAKIKKAIQSFEK